jgi:hypothetical protein
MTISKASLPQWSRDIKSLRSSLKLSQSEYIGALGIRMPENQMSILTIRTSILTNCLVICADLYWLVTHYKSVRVKRPVIAGHLNGLR